MRYMIMSFLALGCLSLISCTSESSTDGQSGVAAQQTYTVAVTGMT